MPPTISIPDAFAYGEDERNPDTPTFGDVEDAAYHIAYGFPGGPQALAKRIGMSASTLEKKVNPNNSTHHLTVREALTIQHFTGNVAILHTMAHALGYGVSRAIPDQSEGDPVMAFAEQQRAQGEFSMQVGRVMSQDGPPSRSDVRRIDEYSQDLHTATANLAGAMRAQMRKPPKLD